MSFTTKIKNEIVKQEFEQSELRAFLSGFIRNNGKFTFDTITLTTENANIVKKMYLSYKNLYEINVEIEKTKGANFSQISLYLLTIKEKVSLILKDLAVNDDNNQYLEKPQAYLIDSPEEASAYLKGVFLAQGSINDPKTSRYHFELFINQPDEAVFVQGLLNRFDLNAKLLTRDKGYMIYIKEAEAISDFLRIVNASNAVLYFEDIRIYRDHKNMTNRLNNCEQANIDKVILTSNEQIQDIKLIEEKLGFDIMDEKLREVSIYRVKYPEASLQELSEIISLETGKKITKSGLNHRLRKIKELAKNLVDK